MSKKWKQFENTKDPDQILMDLFGAEYQQYRDKWKISSGLKKVSNYPIHIDFELNFGCNLQCPQCLLQVNSAELEKKHPYHKDSKKQNISFEKFKEIIDGGVEHGLCSITVGVNNEPLIHPEVVKFIRYAREKGILDVILITNATLLTPELSVQLIDSGLTKIYFSIDAINEETYKVVRKGGDFKTVVDNINNFLKLKKEKKSATPITRVSFVKSKVNAEEADEFIKYWESRVDFVSMQAFMPPASRHSKYDEVKEMFYIENKDLKDPGPCPQPYQRLTIYHDGSVHPCCHWPGATFIVGNIYKESIYDIWNSKKMDLLRIAINDFDKMPKECVDCRMLVFGKVK